MVAGGRVGEARRSWSRCRTDDGTAAAFVPDATDRRSARSSYALTTDRGASSARRSARAPGFRRYAGSDWTGSVGSSTHTAWTRLPPCCAMACHGSIGQQHSTHSGEHAFDPDDPDAISDPPVRNVNATFTLSRHQVHVNRKTEVER